MARMHARRRGKAGSKRPPSTKASWLQLGKAEVEERVVKMHAEGLSAALIGLRLRDQYGVPSVRSVTGRALQQILDSKGAVGEMPDDLTALLKTSVRLQVHLRVNPKDLHNRRGLHLAQAKIRRLADYYKREGRLPADWDIAVKSAELLAQ
jgi:small subunit ribosomal protein S15